MLTAEIKRKIVKEAKRHEKLDAWVTGDYEQKNGVVKHCSIGCVRFALGLQSNIGEHGQLVDPTGVPEYILRMSDQIFEGLPESKRGTWTRRLWSAIPANKDLSRVQDQMSAWLMLDKKIGLAHIAQQEDVRAVAKVIGELYLRRGNGETGLKDEFAAASWQADAAYQQAYAAYQQADAAYQQAYAAYQQADAAYQQAYAASRQAYAAYQQAYAASRQAQEKFWITVSNKLIELVSAAGKGKAVKSCR